MQWLSLCSNLYFFVYLHRAFDYLFDEKNIEIRVSFLYTTFYTEDTFLQTLPIHLIRSREYCRLSTSPYLESHSKEFR